MEIQQKLTPPELYFTVFASAEDLENVFLPFSMFRYRIVT